MTKSVLVFLFKREKDGCSQICLGRKKTGVGKGMWNGIGGKVEKGESSAEAAVREVKEEVSVAIEPNDLCHLGKITTFEPDSNWAVDVFTCRTLDGKIAESEEMEPMWFNIEEIPYDQMWESDKIWMPKVLRDEKFGVKLWLDSKGRLKRQEWK